MLTLEDAIRKFSALPAARMRIADRGVLKAGMWADVVIFDPETIRDLATFENPNQLSEGMRFVLVNGVPVISEGKMTGLYRVSRYWAKRQGNGAGSPERSAREFGTGTLRRRLARQLPQHIRQDAAVAVVLHLLRRVHADVDRELCLFAVVRFRVHRGRAAAAVH